MPLQKLDFIEIEFTGKIKDGSVFDSNIKEDLKALNPKAEPKPLVFCLGHQMFLKGVEDFLIGKEPGTFEIELSPEKAFGKRNPQLIQKMPIRIFQEQKLNPVPGVPFNFDGRIGKILAVSGGRVIVDFNNPLAGKDLVYKVKVLRKVDDLNEKVKALNEFLFRKQLKFEIKNKTLTLYVDKAIKSFVEAFKEKFKEILGFDLEVKEEEKPEKTPKTSQQSL